jgi:hypothetical protein
VVVKGENNMTREAAVKILEKTDLPWFIHSDTVHVEITFNEKTKQWETRRWSTKIGRALRRLKMKPVKETEGRHTKRKK